MKTDNLKIYGIVLMVLAGLVLLGSFSYWTFATWRIIDWAIIIVCGYIGYQVYKMSNIK